ncbi:MAG: MotA/TolQ/ExbB proton channel family protein [Deltaproteobacteria bacterium]|nr:MotA/TolQ/ExbB proton channel family protein [Deltaproteobacteria bacterium]
MNYQWVRKCASLIGLIGFLWILLFIMQSRSSEYKGLFNLPSFLFVVVGHIFIVLYSFGLSDILKAWGRLIKVFFSPEKVSQQRLISHLVDCSKEYQRSGRIAAPTQDMPLFLREGIHTFNGNYNADELKSILKNKWHAKRLQDLKEISVFDFSSKITPALGMMGTVLGLVSLLQNMDDFSQIGAGMALALLTTLYGLLASYAFYFPVIRHVNNHVELESRSHAMMIEALELIKNQVYGPILKENLAAFITATESSSRIVSHPKMGTTTIRLEI